MIIDLMRAFTPDEIGYEEDCGVCGEPFVTAGVVANATTDNREEVGNLCPACVEMLGQRKPEQFPTIEEYEEANRRYPEPMFASTEEVKRLEQARDPSVDEAYDARFVMKGPI